MIYNSHNSISEENGSQGNNYGKVEYNYSAETQNFSHNFYFFSNGMKNKVKILSSQLFCNLIGHGS